MTTICLIFHSTDSSFVLCVVGEAKEIWTLLSEYVCEALMANGYKHGGEQGFCSDIYFVSKVISVPYFSINNC